MTDKENHIKEIKKYLRDNNLKPFSIKTKDGLLYIDEIEIDVFCDAPIDNVFLIDMKSIEKEENGSMIFYCRRVEIGYFHYYKNDIWIKDNKPVEDEDFLKYHLREDNIGEYFDYHTETQRFFSTFNKKNKTKKVLYAKGYVFKKDKEGNLPIALERSKKVDTNNYYMKLNI